MKVAVPGWFDSAMPQDKVRSLRAYALHARNGDDLLDYDTFFAAIAEMPDEETVRSVTSGTAFAIEGLQRRGDLYEGLIVALRPDDVAVYFDMRTGKTERSEAPAGKVLASVARLWVRLDGLARTLVLEIRREGITAKGLELYFSRLSFDVTGARFHFDVTPLTAPSVLGRIDELERVKEAVITVHRPNLDWGDWEQDLNEVIEDSGGQSGALRVAAPRGGSLERDAGVVGMIKSSVYRENPSVVDFVVTGTEPGSPKYVRVTAKDHPVETTVVVAPSDLEVETDERARAAVRDLLSTRDYQIAAMSAAQRTVELWTDET